MPALDSLTHKIPLPDGVSASIEDGSVTISKDGASITREFRNSRLSISVDDKNITVFCDLPRRKHKAIAGTWHAHLKNMVRGIDTGFEYKLKAVYSHFPMTLEVKGNEFVVNNYFGERVPRRADILSGVEVKVSNKVEVTVTGIDKENVGQTAANIERCAVVKNRDRRVFQDGIYLLNKE